VATGDGPFDVTHHTNTSNRALAIHIGGPSQPGPFADSWVDMLFIKGFDAGQPLTAVLERSVYFLPETFLRDLLAPALAIRAWLETDYATPAARTMPMGLRSRPSPSDRSRCCLRPSHACPPWPAAYRLALQEWLPS